MDVKETLTVINAAAYKVRCTLGPGYLESVYKYALYYELLSRGLFVEKEKPLMVYYEQHIVGEFRIDLLVEKEVVIELKAVSELLPAHEAQLVNYLTATGMDVGVLINYGGDRFAFRVKDRIYHRKPRTREHEEDGVF